MSHAPSWMRRAITVRLRLFGLLVIAGAALAVLGHRLLGSLETVSTSLATVAERSLPGVASIGEARASFLRAHLAERSLLFQSLATDSAKATRQQHEAEIAAATKAWAEFAHTHAAIAEQVAFGKPWTEWCKVTREVVTTLEDDTPAARRDAWDGRRPGSCTRDAPSSRTSSAHCAARASTT